MKLFGVCFTIGSGIVAGKEGPFVHAGGLIAHGLSQMASPSLNIDLKYPNQFRNDADQRDFVTIGTATGASRCRSRLQLEPQSEDPVVCDTVGLYQCRTGLVVLGAHVAGGDPE